MLSGSLGRKYAATVNKIGAVSPETLPMDRINPVIILGNAIGNTTFRMVCNLVAPKAKLAFLMVLGIAFKASSVVRITKGKINNPKVNEPAIIESPKSKVLTNKAMPNNPNTIEGILAKLLVMILIN